MDADAESRERLAAKRHRKLKNVSSFAGIELRFLFSCLPGKEGNTGFCFVSFASFGGKFHFRVNP